jgi:hypothetical protein
MSLESMSLAELKAHAARMGITDPVGHKGHKKTWIAAIADTSVQPSQGVGVGSGSGSSSSPGVAKGGSSVDDSMSLVELKAHAARMGITDPDGHKGHKKTWIAAIEGGSHTNVQPSQGVGVGSSGGSSSSPGVAKGGSSVDDSMSLAELKAHAARMGITDPVGHKGHKKTWISAIEDTTSRKPETPARKPMSDAVATAKKLFEDIKEGDEVHVTSGKYASGGPYVVYTVGSVSCRLELPDGSTSGNVKMSSLILARKGETAESYSDSDDECKYIIAPHKLPSDCVDCCECLQQCVHSPPLLLLLLSPFFCRVPPATVSHCTIAP